MSIPTYKSLVSRQLWQPQEGDLIPVSDMTTTHILASLAKCHRDNWRTAFIPIFLEELEVRGLKATNPELFI